MSAVAQSSLPASFEAPPFPAPPEPPAVSEARIRANRANARKSTGPRTPEGKRRSSENALVHGLRAASILAPGEDPRELIAYRVSMIRTTNPRNPIEMEYVEQVIRAGWKLRRYQAAEIKSLEATTNELRKAGLKRYLNSGTALSSTLWDDKQFQALPRYELQYTRMMNRALDELRKLKKDPIYEILGDFAGEMIEAEQEHLRELEPTECPEPEARTESAPNEPNSGSPKLSDALPEAYDDRKQAINSLTDFNEIREMLERELVTAPPPGEAG